MARTSNKDRDVNEMVMGTFRIKSGMWEDFKQLASQNNATATDLIIGFIENCLQSQSIPQSIQDIDNSSQPNLDSIYKYIDSKLDNLDIQSRQNASVIPQPRLDAVYTYIDDKIDNLDNQSIQDIDDTVKKLIAESLEDGDIGDAIAKSYAAMMGNFNELLDKVEELKAAVPPVPVKSPQSPITNNQLPEAVEAEGRSQEAGENLTAGGDGGDMDSDRSPTPDPSPNADFLDKPTIMLHDGSILVVSEKQEKILILLGLIPQTHNILTSQFLGSICKDNLTTNKGELESLIGGKIDSKGSTIRKTAAVLRGAGFTLSGSEGKGFKIIGVK